MSSKQTKPLRKLLALTLSSALALSAFSAAATTVFAAESYGEDGSGGIAAAEHTFSVIGQFNNWNGDVTMTDDDGDGVYEAVLEDISKGNTELKVRMDYDWETSWGYTDEDGNSTGSNYVVNIPARMDVLVTFDTNYDSYENWRVYAEPVEGSDEKYEQNVGKYSTMSLYGTLVGNYDEDADMEYVGNDVYTITLKGIAAGSYETIIRGDHVWNNYWGVWKNGSSKYGDPVQFEFKADVIQLMISIDTSPDDENGWIITYDYNTEDGLYYSGDCIVSEDEPEDTIVLDDHTVGVASDLTAWEYGKDIPMEKTDDNIYYAEIDVPDGYGEFYFKVRLDNSDSYNWGQTDYTTGYTFGNTAPYIYLDSRAAKIRVWFYTGDSDYRCWYMQWDYESTDPDEPHDNPASGNIEDYYYFDDNRTLHILPGFENCKEAEGYFSYDDGVFNVIFENGVKAVPDGLFDGCQELETVQLTDGLVRIGKNAFRDCDKLTGEIIIPETVEYLGESAFAGCRGISLAAVEVGVQTVTKGAFANCTGLTELGLSSNLRKIEAAAFRRCQGLKEVTIRPNVTEIADNAFAGCDSELVIKGVSGTEAESFARRAGFTFVALREYDYDFEDDGTIYITKYNGTDSEVTIPATIDGYQVTRIGACAFILNENIVGVEIPEGVKTIGMRAFSDCPNLQMVILPAGLELIKGGAFMDCPKLVSINFPDSITSFGPHAFGGCGSLERINEVYDLTDMGAEVFNETKWFDNHEDGPVYFGNILIGYKGEADYGTTLEIREGTVGVAAGAMAGSWGARDNITAVTFPESLTFVGTNAFWEMYQYTDIYIPATVTRIEDGAFGCYWDQTESTTGHIGGVVIHGTYGSAAHSYANRNGFEFVSDEPMVTSGTTGDCTWEYNPDRWYLTISGSGAMADYSYNNYAPWCNYAIYNIDVADGVTHIGTDAFIGLGNPEYQLTVSIADSVTSIGDNAFNALLGGLEINGNRKSILPANLTSIGNYAIFNKAYKNVVVPATVTSIGKCGLGYYYDDEIGKDVKVEGYTIHCYKGSAAEQYAIDNGLFYVLIDDSGLEYVINEDRTVTVTGRVSGGETLNIPEKIEGLPVTEIGDNAFDLYNARDVKTVILPSTIKVIGNNAFWGIDSLRSINFPEGLERIGDNALCWSYIYLEDAPALPESLKYLGEWAFFPMNTDTKSITIPAGVEYMGDRSVGYYAPADISAPIDGFTICGTPDTAAQAYAEEYGFEFVDVDAGKLKNKSTVNAENISLGSRIVFTNGAEGGDGTYTFSYFYKKSTARLWTQVNDGCMTATGGFITPKSCAVYDIKMIVTDGTGATAESLTQVTITDGKSTAFSNDSTVSSTLAVPKTRIYLNGAASGSEGYRYAFYYKRTSTSIWTVIGTEFGADTSASFRPASEGDFNVKIDAIDHNGELVSKTFNVKISETADLAPQNLSTVSTAVVSNGTRIIITGAASGGAGGYTYTYEQKKSTANAWNKLGTANTTSTSEGFTARTAGTYDIRVTVTDSAGISVEKEFHIDIV